MPLIRYNCIKCDHSFTSLSKGPIQSSLPCKKCGEIAKRSLSTSSSSSKIVIDNGIQARAVEVDPNIMDYVEHRASGKKNRGD